MCLAPRAYSNCAVLAAGVGLYVHFATTRRRHSSGRKGQATKESNAEAEQADDSRGGSPPAFPIAQSQQPQAGLFEPVGCPPRLGTPGSFNPASFLHSVTSSRSGSIRAGKRAPDFPAALGANKTPLSQATYQGFLEAQHSGAKSAAHSPMTSSDPAGGAVHPAFSTQHSQRVIISAQHAEQAAEESLYQEAAAAEEALGSFSRAPSSAALQSCHMAEPVSATTCTAEAKQALNQAAAGQAAPSATANASCHASANQQRFGEALSSHLVADQSLEVSSLDHAGGHQQSARGVEALRGLQGGRAGAFGRLLPQQGYPEQQKSSATGLQLTAPNGQSLTPGQVCTLLMV